MQDPYLLWITGLSGAGKSSLARRVRDRARSRGERPILLDGDAIREVCGGDLGYGDGDRLKNAYRIARFSHLIVDQGFSVICATVSLYDEIHAFNRESLANYREVYVSCPLAVLRGRDQKGLYSGEADLVGITQACDFPKRPHLVVENASEEQLEENVELIDALIC